MGIVRADVAAMYTSHEKAEFEKLAEINEQIKALEAQKQVAVDSVKQLMQSKNIMSAELGDIHFTLVPAKRRTIARGQKDAFVAELVSNNAKHLITYSIDPDLDSIFAEVDAGTLSKDLVDKYVKVTEYLTLRCS